VIALVLFFTLLLLVIGTPVYIFLGLPAALGTISVGVPVEALAARVYDSLRSDSLITAPMFLLVGNVLISSRAMTTLVAFFDSIVGHFRGGLVIVVVGVAVFFGGISGATTAEAGIMALALAGPMQAAGYPKGFTAGLLAAASTVGILIPPSVPMILYGAITGVSISDLFLAGLVPGLLVATMLGLGGVLIARKNNYGGSRAAASNPERWSAFRSAAPVMAIPIFIVVAIYTGISTASEIGAVAAAASIIVTQFIYRDLGRDRLVRALVDTARVTAAVLIMNGTAHLLGWILTYAQVPQGFTEAVAGANLEPIVYLIALNILFLILGLPLDPPPIMFMTLPILFPTLAVFGIDPVHFGVLMMVNMTIAQVSPPMGSGLFAMATVARIPLATVFRGVMPFIAILLVALAVVTYVPQLSLFLLGDR
jgi:C4-dicarboxylate transporter DctM subunit